MLWGSAPLCVMRVFIETFRFMVALGSTAFTFSVIWLASMNLMRKTVNTLMRSGIKVCTHSALMAGAGWRGEAVVVGCVLFDVNDVTKPTNHHSNTPNDKVQLRDWFSNVPIVISSRCRVQHEAKQPSWKMKTTDERAIYTLTRWSNSRREWTRRCKSQAVKDETSGRPVRCQCCSGSWCSAAVQNSRTESRGNHQTDSSTWKLNTKRIRK